MQKILFVEDEESILKQLKWAFSGEFSVALADNLEDARKILENEKPALIAIDISLSPSSRGEYEGMVLLEEVVQKYPRTKVIIVTGNEERAIAIKAIEAGAYDYYQKPIDIQELKIIIKRALHVQKLEMENLFLQQRLEGESSFEEMIGSCPEMMKVFEMIRRVAPTDATVLIIGETGTGKELVARAIHFQSHRRDKPFVAINCGAIPENLLESELFGHERGAFTDAHKLQRGKFEIANGGTAFLDEIGELGLPLQVKLLRCLQDRQIERVGGSGPIQLDLRIIAATNGDLEKRVREGRFREDLYYRIGVVSIALPPLRDRGDDIILLSNFFLRKFSEMSGRRVRGFKKEALSSIKAYRWPGNIRELENRIKRAVIVADDPLISSADLGLEEAQEEIPLSPLRKARDSLERVLIEKALSLREGNISRAARDLEISRVTLHDLMKRHNISAETYKTKSSG